ncbi:MAG TPA: hypothetical protein VK728_04990 [Candidatus Sulfotelmatobacter sp.]|jgi:hypothetical protein|nr:hypothetical protein [Candidatus Sulfotelmatobacter sp.]
MIVPDFLMVTKPQVLSGALRIVGILILYVAVFLYEDEEGRIQNWLEELWLRVRYGRDVALTTAAAIFSFAAQATSRMFDKVFGPRLFSIRAATISVCFSIASFFLIVPLAVFLFKVSPELKNESYRNLWMATLWVSFAISRALVEDSKWLRVIWYASFTVTLVTNLGQILFVVFVGMGISPGVRLVIFLTGLLALSFVCDLSILGFVRWVVRRASRMTGLFQILGSLILTAFIGIGLVVVPFKMMMAFSPARSPSNLIGLACLAVIPLNVVDLFFSLAVFFVLGLFTLHRLFWPVLERPLYAIARYGVIKQKALLWALGLVLLAGLGNAKSIFQWLVEALPKIKG